MALHSSSQGWSAPVRVAAATSVVAASVLAVGTAHARPAPRVGQPAAVVELDPAVVRKAVTDGPSCSSATCAVQSSTTQTSCGRSRTARG